MPDFTEKPGCQERHLKRRYLNPLFDESRQQVSDQDLQLARQQDQQELQQFSQDLQQLLTEMSQFVGHEDTEKVLAVKETLDRLYQQCMGLAGDHVVEKQGLLKLNEVIMKAIRAAAGQDPVALQELEKEGQARELHLALLEYPLITDLLLDSSPIEDDELVTSILSEDKDTIQMAMSLFDEQQREVLTEQALSIKNNLQTLGLLTPEWQQKFAAFLATPQ